MATGWVFKFKLQKGQMYIGWTRMAKNTLANQVLKKIRKIDTKLKTH